MPAPLDGIRVLDRCIMQNGGYATVMLGTLVLDYPEVIEDAQVVANDYFIDFEHPTAGRVKIVGVPIQLSETPGSVRGMGPQFGEHTHEVLLEAGYTWTRYRGCMTRASCSRLRFWRPLLLQRCSTKR